MRRLVLCLVTNLALVGLMAAVQRMTPQIAPAISQTIGAIQPRVSPDGQSIAVSYQGAIWTVPRAGGAMTRLTHDNVVAGWSTPCVCEFASLWSGRFADRHEGRAAGGGAETD